MEAKEKSVLASLFFLQPGTVSAHSEHASGVTGSMAMTPSGVSAPGIAALTLTGILMAAIYYRFYRG
ncbi:MAG: hypothetical protein SVQ76_02020 [Candidatus Nanohaloarchaea archaeon]|nr:hypothetical protein [Candidatus Nanohaloarchaea archaeon]